jgi:spermidine synthase
MSEYSRFNTKTKKAKHWYTQQMFNYINNNYKKDEPIKILVLGVALGSVIIDLLDNFINANITGIDISDEFYEIVNFYSPKERLELIKTDAKEYVKNENIKYDVIICDIFDNIYLPDFVLDKEFLNNIYKKLKPNGKFLLNSIGISIDKLNSSFKDGFGDNCKITIIPRYPGYEIDTYNIVSFVNIQK